MARNQHRPSIRRTVRLALKKFRAFFNLKGQFDRKKKQHEMTKAARNYYAAINSLSNWERHQWVKAGRPGKEDLQADKVLVYRGLPRHKKGVS